MVLNCEKNNHNYEKYVIMKNYQHCVPYRNSIIFNLFIEKFEITNELYDYNLFFSINHKKVTRE